jgi:hypothetical protein
MAIRKIDPTATFKVISQFDESVQHETPEEMEALKTGKQDENGNDILNPTRFEQYLENLDDSLLRLKDGVPPTYFVIRCLKNSEVAELNEKHVVVNVVEKKIEHKNRQLMFLEMFDIGCLGTQTGDGKLEKTSGDEVGYAVAVAMGSVISLFTSLGKHLKKS